MKREVYIDGVLREQWDDATRTYTAWDESGTVITQRPYTAEENANADVGQQQQEEQANAAQVTSDLDQALIDVQVLLDTPNQEISDTPAPYIKDLGHMIKDLIKKANSRYEDAG